MLGLPPPRLTARQFVGAFFIHRWACLLNQTPPTLPYLDANRVADSTTTEIFRWKCTFVTSGCSYVVLCWKISVNDYILSVYAD